MNGGFRPEKVLKGLPLSGGRALAQVCRLSENRHTGLEKFGFDPFEDIALDTAGLWRWASPKPEMHRFVADYFAQRREDG